VKILILQKRIIKDKLEIWRIKITKELKKGAIIQIKRYK
jgi:hypothetical protein